MLKFLRVTKQTLLCLALLTSSASARGDPPPNAEDYKESPLLKVPQYLENYNFDFSAHVIPKAYDYQGASVMLHHKVKLIPDVKDRQGAIVLNRVSFFKFY